MSATNCSVWASSYLRFRQILFCKEYLQDLSLLTKTGPQIWITGQIILWGIVAAMQMFCKSRASLLASGFFLGALEAGFIPGSLYYLSTWYKSGENAVRNRVFFFGKLGS